MTSIESEIKELEITRVCHAMPLVNLIYVLKAGKILSVEDLKNDESAVFDQSDKERHDGELDKVNCSIEYPNGYYVRHKIKYPTPEQKLAPDWVCLMLDPQVLVGEDVKFCPHNAGGFGGANIAEGLDALKSMYAQTITAPSGPYSRSPLQLKPSPTDIQAEVLIPSGIPVDLIRAIVAKDEATIEWVYEGLAQLLLAPERYEFRYSPQLFAPSTMSNLIRSGRRPTETVWQPETAVSP